jgi:hypothetical protein
MTTTCHLNHGFYTVVVIAKRQIAEEVLSSHGASLTVIPPRTSPNRK